MKILTHLHLAVYTWWRWHICKGEVVGVELDQLGEEKKVFRCTLNYGMVLGLEFYIDPLCFASYLQVGCVPSEKLSKISKIIEIGLRS